MRQIFLFILFFAVICIHSLSAQVIEAQQEVEIIVDNDGDGKANSQDVLRYRVTIINTGGGDGEEVQLIISPDGRTTLVPGSFISSPVAFPNSYDAVGNVGIEVPVAEGLMSNDFDDDPDALTVTAETKSTDEGGMVDISADGSFIYTPPDGFTGEDTFTYELNDGTPVAGGPTTDTGTVTMNVNNLIWFVDNTGGGSGGSGTLADPFLTLTDFNSASESADDQLIFITHTGTNYDGGIVLQNGQALFGSGHTGGVTLADVLPFTLPPHTPSLPSIDTAAPVITNGSGNGVTLASNNQLRGFTVGNTSGVGVSGSSFGTLSVSEVAINGNGQALGLSAGEITGNGFTSVSSGSPGARNVLLTNVGGTLAMGSGSLSGATTSAFEVSGGSATITYSGFINTTGSARPVRVLNKNGGSVTLSGDVTGANGILLTDNSGSAISFQGALSLNTGSNTAFEATGGGTIIATGSASTLTVTTATALRLVNTTIGAGNLTFQSISSNGGSATGIILNNTGSSGGLIVSSSGTAGSGGTIANKSGSDSETTNGIGIYLNNTGSVKLSRMQLNDFANYAILGENVIGFELTNSIVNGANGTNTGSEAGDMNTGVDQGSIRFLGLTGEALVANSTISGGIKDNFWVQNTSGTLNRLVLENVTMGLHSTSDGNNSLRLVARGTSVFNATIIDSDFLGARGDQLDFRAESTGNADLVFMGNTLVNNHPSIATGGGGVTLLGGENGNFDLQFENNTMRDAMGSALVLVKTVGNGQISGSISDNVIGVSGVANSGSVEGSGINIRSNGGGTMNIAVTGNQVYQYNNFGIIAQAGAGVVQGGNLNVNVIGNTIANPGNNPNIDSIFQGLHLNSGVTPGDSFQVCFDAQNNTMTNSGRNGGTDTRLRQRQNTTVRLPGYTGGATDTGAVQTYLEGRNVTPFSGAHAASGTGFGGGGVCF